MEAGLFLCNSTRHAIAFLEFQLALNIYMSNQERLTSNTTIAPIDLEVFLAQRGCLRDLKQGLEITPDPKGSGRADISINHDRFLDKQSLEE